MTTGTKSILFGTHQFFIHPFFVLLGWIKFFKEIPPFKVWVAIFIHDWGYWGTEKIISKEGAEHSERSAWIIERWYYANMDHKEIYVGYPDWEKLYYDKRKDKYWQMYNFIKYHGENFAEKDNHPLSPLYFADKLGAVMTPIWLNSILCVLSGESKEYWDFLGGRISLRVFFKRYKLWVQASVASYLGEEKRVG